MFLSVLHKLFIHSMYIFALLFKLRFICCHALFMFFSNRFCIVFLQVSYIVLHMNLDRRLLIHFFDLSYPAHGCTEFL